MPAGKLLACEPYGPLGIIGSQGAVVLLESSASGGRSVLGVLCSSVRKVMKVAGSPLVAWFREGNKVVEARLTNSDQGHYMEYPLNLDE